MPAWQQHASRLVARRCSESHPAASHSVPQPTLTVTRHAAAVAVDTLAVLDLVGGALTLQSPASVTALPNNFNADCTVMKFLLITGHAYHLLQQIEFPNFSNTVQGVC